MPARPRWCFPGGSLTTAATQTLVNGITYQNTNTDNPSAGNRVVHAHAGQGQRRHGQRRRGHDHAVDRLDGDDQSAVDDAPVATITPTSYGPVNEQTGLTLAHGPVDRDVDAGSGSLTVTLSVTEGTLNVTLAAAGAGVSASPAARW